MGSLTVDESFDLICIGSGPAGQRAAIQAAKLGGRVAVIERRQCVGGVCIQTGTIPSKTLREAVLSFCTLSGVRALGSHGSDFVVPQRPKMAELLGRVGRVIEDETAVIEDQLGRNGVELYNGVAEFLDPHVLRVTSPNKVQMMRAERVLIAVGTEPAHPPGVSPDADIIITPDQIMHVDTLPRTLAVVGGGVIGLEYASMFGALGIQVTLIDRRTRLLEFLDNEITDELVHQMRQHGVTFRLGEAVERLAVVEDRQRLGLIRLESGKHIVADMVLFSVGRMGATGSLNLEAAGLVADERGRLEVNDQFCTSVPHIYAAGDVIGYPSLAATSGEQGRLAACHMFGLEVEPMADHFPIGIYAIPEISMVGRSEEDLTRSKVPYETGVARFREIARGQILGDDSGLFKMIFHRESHELLGVHCIGTGATELIHVGQAVLGLQGGLGYFLRTIFNYPTLAECYKVAALNAANKLRFARRVETILEGSPQPPPPEESTEPPRPTAEPALPHAS